MGNQPINRSRRTYAPNRTHQSSSLDPRKQRAALLVATAMRKRAIAAEVGVTRKTIWRWEQEEAFIQSVATHCSDPLIMLMRRGFGLPPVPGAENTVQSWRDHGWIQAPASSFQVRIKKI